MKTWAVTVPMAGHAYIEVEAETEEAAIEQALLDVSLNHVENIEALTKVNSGSVCHFPTPWEIESRCVYDDELNGDTSEPLGPLPTASNYSDLRKRLDESANATLPGGIPPGPVQTVERPLLREASAALAELERERDEAREALAPFAAKARSFTPAYLLRVAKVDIIVDGAALLQCAELHARLSQAKAKEDSE